MYSYAVLPVNCNGRPGSQRDDMGVRDCEQRATGRGDGLAIEPMSRNPEGRGSIPRLGSCRSSFISIEHAELLRSTPSLVLCLASNHGIACALRLGPTPLVTDFWG